MLIKLIIMIKKHQVEIFQRTKKYLDPMHFIFNHSVFFVQVDTIDVSPGVVIKEKGVIKRGLRQVRLISFYLLLQISSQHYSLLLWCIFKRY